MISKAKISSAVEVARSTHKLDLSMCMIPYATQTATNLPTFALTSGLHSLTHTQPNSAIPRAVLTIRNLKRLNLTSNQISKLPVQPPHACSSRSSSCLNRAHTLCGTHASFTQATIGQLKQLRQLDLTWNQLTVLPNEIGIL